MSQHTASTPRDPIEIPSEPPTEHVYKRQRVARACQKCRLQKVKCDGRHPSCGRCEGYGHTCTWSDEKRERREERSQSSDPGSERATRACTEDGPTLDSLTKSVQLYEELIRNLRRRLPTRDLAVMDLTLSQIRQRLPIGIENLLQHDSTEDSVESHQPRSQRNATDGARVAQRYVGQASDIWFFNALRGVIHDEPISKHLLDNPLQSCSEDVLLKQGPASEIPPRGLADSYIETYFSTIHVAYPFINKSEFIEKYEKFWAEDFVVHSLDDSWLSLLYTLFAIGSYYASFPHTEKAKAQIHLCYFEKVLSLGESMMTECTLANVQTLLAQCFFLLATGQTDRCWNTLGLAIRVGQSIGLYVDDSLKIPKTGSSPDKKETMRRTWYSMYVLDRLLALQLGRPAAIHEDGYSVNLPSRTAEDVSEEANPSSTLATTTSSSLDYFHCVIRFSWILGKVITDLFSPSQVVAADSDGMLLRTAALDQLLLNWKLGLPRHLRFDLGHTFERSIIYRKQRNMLAIKFHHLRALIHRPYLCYSWLQRTNQQLKAMVERDQDQVSKFEKTCVSEAQEIAHRLNTVFDETSLIYDFPWWQMISCLLCASSILLVARACTKDDGATSEPRTQLLDEDAETCLKVFDALSSNSDAARRARDIMKWLKRIRFTTRNVADTTNTMRQDTDPGNVQPVSMVDIHSQNVQYQTLDYRDELDWSTWPGDLPDAVTWSAQFLNPAQSLSFDEDSSACTTLDFSEANNYV